MVRVHHEHCASDNISPIILPEIDHAMRESGDDSDSRLQVSKGTDIEAASNERESRKASDLERKSRAVKSPCYPCQTENYLLDLVSIFYHDLEAMTNQVREKK